MDEGSNASMDRYGQQSRPVDRTLEQQGVVMKLSRLLLLSLSIVAILTVFLAGCSHEVEVTPSPLASETLPPIKTAIPYPSVTSTQPNISTTTETVNGVIITETPAPPTQAVTSTLTADETETLVWDLLENNYGCKLPCWWGFTPGMTEWLEVSNFFKTIDQTPRPYKNTFHIQIEFTDRGFLIGQTYTISPQGVIETINAGVSVLHNNRIVFTDSIFEKELNAFLLPSLLSNYGKPQEVLLRTYPWAREAGDTPFYLIVNYTELGISMLYEGEVERENSHYQICPQHASFNIFLWDPEKSTEEVVRTARQNQFLEEDSGYRKLDESTGLSLEEFYETFKNAQNEACLSTPSDYWEP